MIKRYKQVMLHLAILSIAVVALSFASGIVAALRIVAGTYVLLFLPGFLMSYIFFPVPHAIEQDRKQLQPRWSPDPFSRLLLACALSMATIPLVLFIFNKIGVSVNLVSVATVVGVILAVEAAFLIIINKKTDQPGNTWANSKK